MPIYEYICPECDARFEELVGASRAADVACPSCGSPKPDRLLSIFSAPVGATAGADCLGAPPSEGCGAGGCSIGAGGACPEGLF